MNSLAIMVDERAAELIKGKGMLEPSAAEVGLGKDWGNLQCSTTTSKNWLRPRSECLQFNALLLLYFS